MAARSTATPRDVDEALMLAQLAAALRRDGDVYIVGTVGQHIPLPPALVTLLRDALELLHAGVEVQSAPERSDLSEQQAARVLNIRLESLRQLLDEGELPFETVGGQRRVPIRRLIIYKAMRDAQTRQALDELTQLSQELGLYDFPVDR